VTIKEFVTTRGVTIGHPLISARLELTVVHEVVVGMSGTSVGSRLKNPEERASRRGIDFGKD
jgi:hypothetical protein